MGDVGQRLRHHGCGIRRTGAAELEPHPVRHPFVEAPEPHDGGNRQAMESHQVIIRVVQQPTVGWYAIVAEVMSR